MRLLTRNNNIIYFIAALLSIVLAIDGSLRATVINPDGICYLQSAATIGSQGLHATMQICGQAQWPIYSALIFVVVTITKLSFIHAAFALNGLLSLISVVTFIYLVHLLGGTRVTLWFAAATILLMHEFNSVREYVIRDHGFWAFYLISVAMLIQYLRAPNLQRALLWSGALLVATMFRVEGVIFLTLVPFVTVFAASNRFKQFLQLNALTILAAILFAAVVPHTSHSLQRLTEIQFQFAHGINALSQNFHAKAIILAQTVLNGYSARDASLILGLTLFSWYLINIITNLSVIYAGLFTFACWRKSLTLDKPARLAITVYIAINILITAAFLTEYMFLSKRYLIALTLLLALWIPFALTTLWRDKRQSIFAAVMILMVGSALGGIFDFGYSKTYIRDAGVWLANNTSAQDDLYSNDLQVMFYSKHFGNDIFVKAHEFAVVPAKQLKKFDYIVLHVSLNPHDEKTTSILKTFKTTPVKVFANKRGDAIVIYKKGE